MADIALRHVTKRYGQFLSVDDLSLDIAQGELVAFVGPSGCGKTTTLRMIAGLAELSGGQQQRVALARAIAIKPAALLLDEPLSALDAKLRLEVRKEIRRLQQSLGLTTVFVTHDQEEAVSIADRIVVMNAGKIEQV